MAALRADYTSFIADYKDALACDMHFREFLTLTGISHFMLNDRLKMLAARGIVLPKLKGMRHRKSCIITRLNGRARVRTRKEIVGKTVRRTARVKPPAQPCPPADQSFVICVGG